MLERARTSAEAEHCATASRLNNVQSKILENRNDIQQTAGTVRSLGPSLHQESAFIQHAIEQLGEKTSIDLTLLRNDILREITAQTQRTPESLLNAHLSLSPSEAEELAKQLLAQLVRYPSSLRQAFHGIEAIALSEHQDTPLVSCSTKSRQRKRQRQWSFSINLPLVTLIRRTIRLTFEASFKAGGISIGQTIRCYNIVQRSKSPAFRLFDDFPATLGERFSMEKMCPQAPEYHRSGQEKLCFCVYYLYNPALAKTRLRRIYYELRQLFQHGLASARDTDEFGNSLLHVSN